MTCTICRHQDEMAVNLSLVAGEPTRSIAVRTGLSKTALIRHKLHCIPRDLVQARQSGKVAEADFLLAQITRLHRRADNLLQKAEEASDFRSAAALIRELRALLELLCRLSGELRQPAQVNLLVTAEYRSLREQILRTLAPYPQARLAISSALARLPDAGA
jgi:hypothetical protein